MKKQIKRWKWGYILISFAIIALGICLILWPGVSAGVLCDVVGMVLTAIGAFRCVSYFLRGMSALWHRYELPLGIFNVLLGVYFLSHPDNVLLLLPVVVGLSVLVDSVFKLQNALELRACGAKSWWGVLILSIASILVALFLIRNPFAGAVTLMTYLGICLVVDGVQSLVFAYQAAKYVRATSPIDVSYVTVE